MKRQTKRLALTLLLSAALVGTNLQLVFAQEESVTDVEEPSSEAAAVSQDDGETKSDGGTNQTESTTPAENVTPTESTTPAGNTAPAENTTPAGDTAPAESTTPTVTGTDTINGGTAPSGETQAPVTKEDNGTDETGTGAGTEPAEGTEQDAQNPDTAAGEDGTAAGGAGTADNTAAADSTENGQPEQTFVNKNGEEVKPSDLVGVDYNTVAESYDGETNAVKQYVVSDEAAKDTIMDSYVDENGNLVMVISQGAPVSTEEEEKDESVLEEVLEEVVGYNLDADLGSSSSAPPVDGSFSGWDDVPASYEFNWNKPDAWVDDTHYTETNSTDVRHEMKLYSDGENVYLKVVFAREFKNGQIANGNDYQFWIDDEQMAAYQVEWPDGKQLSYNSGEPGVYKVDVRHRDSSWSYVLTDGAVAYYHINEGNLNNELELKIPMSEFVKQNPNINLDNYSMISFFTPNLMQGKISTAGASTGAEPFAAAAFLLVPTSCILIKRKNNKGDLTFA